MTPAGFTETVRQEVAVRPLGTDEEVAAELGALFDLAGRRVTSSGARVFTSSSGAAARRVFVLLQRGRSVRAEVAVRASGAHRTYEVRCPHGVDAPRGVTGAAASVPAPPGRGAAQAYVRGAVLASGSFSAPGRAPHCEFRTPNRELAVGLRAQLTTVLGDAAAVSADSRHRVAVKSGAAIGELLVAVGAPGAFMEWDERRLRRELRNDANRLANADSANLERTIAAASSYVEGVEAVLERVGWDALDAPLREVALARLANPSASLQELGQLLDPPVGKSTVHRRLSRLLSLPDERSPSDRA